MAEIILNYPSRLVSKSPPGNALLRMAMWSGVAPLASGLLCFLAGWLAKSVWLLYFAVGISLVVGTFALFLGMFCLITHYVKTLLYRDPSPRRSLPTGGHLLTLMLLCINFPIAYGMMNAAKHINETYTVTVVNKGPSAIDELAVDFSDGALHVGGVAPGANVSRGVRFYRASAARYRMKQGVAHSAGDIGETPNGSDSDPPIDLQITVNNANVEMTPAPGGNEWTHSDF